MPPQRASRSSRAARRTAVVAAVASLSPFAAALVVYRSLLDFVPENWFSAAPLRYLFVGLCALCAGLLLRLAGQPLVNRFGTAASPRRPMAGQPEPRELLALSLRHLEQEHRETGRPGARLGGWSQYFGDRVPPTAVGTSYGLRMMNLLDVRDPRLSRPELIDTLLSLQRPGGGWAASTQRDRARPEITSWVLSAMVRAGLDRGRQEPLVRLLEDMLDPALDGIGMQRTSVLSVTVSALAEVAPHSPRLAELAERLLDGAVSVDHEGAPLVCWGEKLNGPGKSVPHTARAVVSLHRAATALGDGAHIAAAASAGLAWLCAGPADLRPVDEQLRRPVTDGSVDVLFVGHFTAAWMARAIMTADDVSPYEDRLREALDGVLAHQENGVWRWSDGSRPIWMTYQGATVVRDCALRGMT